MKKALFLILVFVLHGFFIQPAFAAPAEEKHNAFKEQEGDAKIGSEKIRSYLKDSVLQSKVQGKIAADYYEFGQDRNSYYMWAYIAEFIKKNGKFKLRRARSGPLVIMVSKDGAIQGHWEPEPGERYTESIKEKFPHKYHDDVLHFQSEHQNTLNKLKVSVRRKATKEELLENTFDLLMAIGEIQTIKFDANRTTGYTWQYRVADPEVADVIFDAYLRSEHKENVLGAGGKRAFGIKGKHKGITRIELQHARDWNAHETDKTQKIRVKVKEAQEADLDQPNVFATEYIADHNWEVHSYSGKEDYPSGFSLSDSTVSCRETDDHPNRELIEKTIEGRQYCLQISSEGTAGSTYTTYTYATVRKTSLLTVGVTLRFPRCDVYSEPQRLQCKREQEEMNVDKLVNSLVDALLGTSSAPVMTPGN